jgi:hypothetical protein
MPVVDDEFKLPEFPNFSRPPIKKTISKKQVNKKTVDKASSAEAKAPLKGLFVAKAPSAAAKAPSAAAKAPSAAAKAPSAAAKAPLKGLFVARPPPEGLFVARPPPEGLFMARPPPEGLFMARPPPEGLFATKAPSAATKAPPPEGLFETNALLPEGLFAAKAPFTAKAPSRANVSKALADTAFVDEAPSAALSLGMGLKSKIKKPVSFPSPIDTFTTAKCGRPFCANLVCDPPYVDLVRTLSEHTLSQHAKGAKGAKGAKDTKDEVRQLIEDTMVRIRAEPRHADALTRAENKIRCHKKGSNMTELFLFGPSFELPIVESVSMVDLNTGDVRDVHEMFGLVKKTVVRTLPNVVPDAENMREGLQAKANAEMELEELLKMPHVNPFYVDMKRAHIQTIDATIAGELKESKFEYSPELKEKYGERVKLSDLLKIGISNGLDPDNDVVAVYACRVPDERVMQLTLPSPRGNESDASVGGGSKTHKARAKKSRHKTYKRKRMKRQF